MSMQERITEALQEGPPEGLSRLEIHRAVLGPWEDVGGWTEEDRNEVDAALEEMEEMEAAGSLVRDGEEGRRG